MAKILIVEDEANIARFLELELKHEGYEVDKAPDGRLGLQKEDCIVFEDLLRAVKGAVSGGFRTIGVYDKQSEDAKEEIMSIADGYIYDFTEMIK